MASQEPNYKLYYSEELKTSRWLGHPDPNYAWEGERFVWERIVKDENGKDVLVKTYKDPIEIIADFKPESKVYGIEGDIERNAVKKFGGALKGFIWLDKISGGGEVVLPFTAKHIFIATGDRLNPKLTEISTDPNFDNYYEVIEGKTRVVVKSFSGIGGAAGSPPTLIAHYKFNENTAGDSDNKVTNGTFDADTDWDKGIGWSIAGGFASCDGSQPSYSVLRQSDPSDVIEGRKYKFTFTLNNRIAGTVQAKIEPAGGPGISTNGTHSILLVAVGDSDKISLTANADFIGDVDDVSVKLCAVEDSSGNDHDGLAQQDTSAISVAGKINTAFDFNGTSDFIAIQDHDDFDVSTISISIWVNPDNLNGTNYLMTKLEDTDSEISYGIFIFGDGKISFILSIDGTTMLTKSSSAGLITIGKWNHIVIIYKEGVGVKFYVNGVFDKLDATETGALYIGTGRVTIGARFDSSTGTYKLFFDGLIDIITFFSVELTPDEVNILYNANSGTEIIQELDSQISPRRGNLSPLPLRRRWEF